MNGRPWKQEENLLLVKNQRKMVPHKVTAKLLDRTVKAVRNHASDYGFLQPRKGPWHPDEDALLRHLIFVAGTTRRYAAKQLNRTPQAVRQRMNRLGWRATDPQQQGVTR